MLSNNYKTVLVTGASSGIGEAVVKTLSKKGYKITALARRKSKLIKLKKETGCEILIMDIKKTTEVEKLKKRKFDIFINNAGLGRGFEKIYKTKATDIANTIDTNVKAFSAIIALHNSKHGKKKNGSCY